MGCVMAGRGGGGGEGRWIVGEGRGAGGNWGDPDWKVSACETQDGSGGSG